jgi:hypothetical protein
MVRWQLLFTEVGRWPGAPPEHEVTLTGRAEPFGWEFGEQDRTDVRLRVGCAVLYWSAPEELAGAVTATGTVHEDHHTGVPEDFPCYHVQGTTDPGREPRLHRGSATVSGVGVCRAERVISRREQITDTVRRPDG